ncbi:MAG: hypothetical protein GEV11_24275 [Streptosporangiales bacterium]|nr:hypothetical protein [Streptosporangiales bacterium]
MRAEDGRWWPIAAAGGAVLAGLAAAPAFGLIATVPTAVAVAAAVLNVRPASHSWWAWSGGLAAAVSIAASAAYPRAGSADVPASGGVFGYVEMLALMVMVGGLARWAPLRQAIGLAAAGGAAVVALVLRLIMAMADVSAVAAGIACAIFSVGTVTAAALGTYLRLLDLRRLRAVAGARRAQRAALAQDLHDFVAHDVSVIVAQAQAGQLVALPDPERAADLFARIEQAGQRVEVRRTSGTALEVVVTNDRGGETASAPRAFRRSGLGLPGLAERVQALGGDFTAGPHGDGWRVVAVLPTETGRQQR